MRLIVLNAPNIFKPERKKLFKKACAFCVQKKSSFWSNKRDKTLVNLSTITVRKKLCKKVPVIKYKLCIYRAYGSRKLQYIFTEQRS